MVSRVAFGFAGAYAGAGDDPFGLLADLDLTAAGAAAAMAAAGRGGVAAAAAAAAAAVAKGDRDHRGDGTCAQCGARMTRGTSDLEYTCQDCGLIVEGDTAEPDEDGAPRAAPNAARLRIVGPNSNQLQPDLYRSGGGNTAASQKKQIYDDYCKYRTAHIESGGRAFPLDACKLASEHYNEVQAACVKRSERKKAIMAACFYHACLKLGFAPSKAEVATFMQLPSNGIACGVNFVRTLVADGKMDIDINADPCRPEITSLFAHLGLDGDKYAHLRDAVEDVVRTAVENNIGTSSVLRSKVAGAAFIVLRRRREACKPIGILEFCGARIRKNTVERFTRAVDSYHDFFRACYERAGLNTDAPSL